MAHDSLRARGLLALWAIVLGFAVPLLAHGGTPVEPESNTPRELSPLLATSQALSATSYHVGVSSPALVAGKGSKGGSRAGKSFTPTGRKEIDAANAEKNGGANKCENCGTDVVPGEKSQRGVAPPLNQRERDHIVPKSKGGDGTPANGQVLCRECNLDKSDQSQ